MEINFLSISLVFIIISLLVIIRNYLFKQISEPYPQLLELTSKKVALLSLLLMSGVVLWMLVLASFSFTNSLIILALTVSLMLNFRLVHILHAVLSRMRKYKQLSIYILLTFPIMVMIGFVVSVELSFLYWIKDVEIYFQTPFWQFVLGYSLFIGMIAHYLSLRNNDSLFQKNWRFIILASLDSIIIVLLTVIFLYIILIIINLLFILGP